MVKGRVPRTSHRATSASASTGTASPSPIEQATPRGRAVGDDGWGSAGPQLLVSPSKASSAGGPAPPPQISRPSGDDFALDERGYGRDVGLPAEHLRRHGRAGVCLNVASSGSASKHDGFSPDGVRVPCFFSVKWWKICDLS